MIWFDLFAVGINLACALGFASAKEYPTSIGFLICAAGWALYGWVNGRRL